MSVKHSHFPSILQTLQSPPTKSYFNHERNSSLTIYSQPRRFNLKHARSQQPVMHLTSLAQPKKE